MYKLRFEERVNVSPYMIFFSPLFAILISLIFAGILIIIAGASP